MSGLLCGGEHVNTHNVNRSICIYAMCRGGAYWDDRSRRPGEWGGALEGSSRGPIEWASEADNYTSIRGAI